MADKQTSELFEAKMTQIEIEHFEFAQDVRAAAHRRKASTIVAGFDPALAGAYKGGNRRKEMSDAYWAERTPIADRLIAKHPKAKNTEIARWMAKERGEAVDSVFDGYRKFVGRRKKALAQSAAHSCDESGHQG